MVVTALRAALIIGLATSMAQGSGRLYWTMTDGISAAITKTVTGSSKSLYKAIDKNVYRVPLRSKGPRCDHWPTLGDFFATAMNTYARAHPWGAAPLG